MCFMVINILSYRYWPILEPSPNYDLIIPHFWWKSADFRRGFRLIHTEFLKGFPHGDEVFGRHIGLDIVNGIEYVAAAGR